MVVRGRSGSPRKERMELDLYTVVHPIGPDNYPGQQRGWRWAIHTDARFEQWQKGCINAGWEADRSSAEAVLSVVLITARRALFAAGVKSNVSAHVLADCPFTAGMADELAVLI